MTDVDQMLVNIVKRADTLLEEVILQKILFSFQKGVALKGKNLLPVGANSFLLEQTPFQTFLKRGLL